METENLQEKLALIFGWSHERVLQTRFPKIIEKLVDIVEDYEKNIQMQKEEKEEYEKKIKYYKDHIGMRRTIKQMDTEAKQSLIDELTLTKSKLKIAEQTIDSIEVFIKEKQR